jgi:Na+/phosphate symporter
MKTKDAKYQIKLLRKKIKYMEHNKKEYKATIINQARQIEQMQEEIKRLKKNLNP